MYTTIEADIENGRIKGPESQKLPATAHVLITFLSSAAARQPDWNVIRPQLGKLKIRGNTAEWQRRIRSEWD